MPVATGKTLTAKVDINNRSALRALQQLDTKINSINNKVKTSTTNINQADKAVNKLNRDVNTSYQNTKKVADAAKQTTRNFNQTSSAVSSLTSKVRALASAYLGVMGARALITTSDTITSAENKLNTLDGGSPVATQTAMDKMFVSSQNARTGYTDMISNVSKAMTLAGDAFNGNIDNAIRFQEIMSMAYSVGGASAAEQASSMYQMIQALGSGVLQGDELRSVREGAAVAYKEIEKFAQKIYQTDESLKDLASDGLITSDIVVAAIMDAGDTIEGKFSQTSMTFAQAFTNMKNTATKSFESVLQTMNDVLNSDVGIAIIQSIETAIQYIAGAVNLIFQVVGAVFNWFSENWYWIQYIVYAVLIAIGYYLSTLAAQAIITGATMLISFLTALSPLYIWIVVIGAIIALFVYMAGSFQEACGLIVGVVFAVGATIWNIVVGLINGIIQFLWTFFVEPYIDVIEFILNCCNGGFNSFGDAVKNLLGNIIGWFLSLGTVVTKIIDAIFGTDWTTGLNDLKNDVLDWGKNEEAITLDRSAYELERLDVTDSFDLGYDYGVTGGEWVTNKISEAGDWLSDKLNVGSLTDTDSLSYSLGNIEDNTDSIADSMELTSEDLEYLRKVAETEWKKEFTTASITVDMSNYNTVNSDSDLDGIVTKLSAKLYEELQAVADGVYV